MRHNFEEYKSRRDFLIERLNKIPGVYSPMPMGAFIPLPVCLLTMPMSFVRGAFQIFVTKVRPCLWLRLRAFMLLPVWGETKCALLMY